MRSGGGAGSAVEPPALLAEAPVKAPASAGRDDAGQHQASASGRATRPGDVERGSRFAVGVVDGDDDRQAGPGHGLCEQVGEHRAGLGAPVGLARSRRAYW